MAGEKKKNKKEKVVEEESPVLNGVYVFPNGDKYDGEYIHLPDGGVVRSGHGKHISADGIVCEGKWEGNKMNGSGVVKYPSGAMYEGDILDNMMHGKGKYVFQDLAVYEGDFEKNRLNGNGTYIDSKGQSWCGAFDNKSASSLRFKLNV